MYSCSFLCQVTSEYKKEINIKIKGTGVGGCDIIMEPGQANTNDCWCLWGTLNYAFCAYTKNPVSAADTLNGTVVTTIDESQFEISSNVTETGRCPVVTGESLLCSDLDSLGNCYKGAYACDIDVNGFCHCSVV